MTGTRTSALDRFKEAYWPRYKPHLQECELRLTGVTCRPEGTLGEACVHTLSAGGKRLRPLLVFLSSRKGSGIIDAHYAAAAAVELVHSATLVHDDILDGAALRRGRPTLAAAYGTPFGTAAGDYLFATAFEILANTGSPAAIAALSRAGLDLSLGELLQREQEGDFDLTPESYIKRCRLKTSSLFAAACRFGALFSGCPEEAVAAIGEFGARVGLAFQIADDILDFTGDPASTGKRAGADLRDGTVTLPLLLAMRRDRSIRKLAAGNLEEDGIDEICGLVAASGALEEARAQGEACVRQAKEMLAGLSVELETEPLAMIAESTMERKA